MSSIENGTTNRRFSQKKTPPKWLNEEERMHWLVLPEWRTAFENEKTHLMRTTLLRFGLINGTAVIASLILTAVIWKTNFDLLFKLPTLISMANITCTTAATVTAIILAFVVFLFGHAKRLEEESRNSISPEIQHLGAARVQIADWAHGEVRETAGKYKEKAQNLIDAANKFDNALYELTRRFAFATKRGSYCDDRYLRLLNTHIFERAGAWFVAYLQFWESFPTNFNHREFARRTWNDADIAAKNLCRLNENIKDSEDEHQQALDLSISLPSFLLVVVIALLSISVADNIHPFLVTWMTITLVALLATHLISLVYGIIRLMLRETIIRVANRQSYLQEAAKYTRVNVDDMVKDSLELLKAHPDISEIVKKLEDQLSSDTM